MLEEDRMAAAPGCSPGAQGGTLPFSDSAAQLDTCLPFLQRKRSPRLLTRNKAPCGSHALSSILGGDGLRVREQSSDMWSACREWDSEA